ncbi:MAG: hypothetical protein ABSH56_13590 [Bryobacteraceae bacterium]
MGVDLGQARDPSATAVVERVELVGEWDPAAWAHRKEIGLRLRRLERLPLGMKYPEIEDWVVRLMEAVARHGDCELAADATGVGRPVVDHLREAGLKCGMRAVMVTGGQTERSEAGYDYVPKRDLMAGLQVLFEYGELKIAKRLQHVDALKKEMADMRMKVTAAGNEQYGAWRQGEHDDLVFAVALACWAAKRCPQRPRVTYRLPGLG